MPNNLLTRDTMATRVNGLREVAPPSKVRVYDATTKELKRIEEATFFQHRFNNRRTGKCHV